VDYGEAICLHDWIAQQAERSPEAVAVESEDEQITYRELMRRAGAVASALRGLGVQAEKTVGICCERSLEMMAGLLGILQAGGAYVPLELEYPAERMRWVVEDAGIEVVLTQERLQGRLDNLPLRTVVLDRDWSGEQGCPSEAAVDPDNAAYIIYTSGSTGRPKGVVNTHRAIINRLRWMQAAFGLQAGEGVLQKTPYSFDVSVWEMFWALGVGGRVVMARPGGHKDPAYLSEAIEQHGITTIHFVPSMLEAFLKGGALRRCGGLRRVISSGEALSESLEVAFRRELKAELHNLYGPTEAAVDVSWWACNTDMPNSTGWTPIGKPIGNLRLYVLDEGMDPCPVGARGELYIGGVGLGRGYVKLPGLTAEKFVPDPHARESGGRLYRTGDLARYRADGNIEFLGRIDDQVKIRGFRIELGDIEAALRTQVGVREAVVVVRGKEAEKRLAAYLVGEREETRQLRVGLREHLPDYMVPSTFTWLEQLPVTANGKLDRKALPEPEADGERERPYMAPQTAIEEELARIWAEVLGLPRVSVEDNFFELGGDSILCVQIVARAAQAGLRFTTTQLFQHQTVAEMAGVVTTSTAVVEQGLARGEVTLTPIQEWFFDQQQPVVGHWNQAVLLEVRKKLSTDIWQEAVCQLVRHHDGLRMRYELQAGRWCQHYADSVNLPRVKEIDLRRMSDTEQVQAIEEAAGVAQSSLDLSAGPVLQVVLMDLGTSKPGRLLLVAHHLVMDVVSWRLLVEDLQRSCEQLERTEVVQLPPKTNSYQAWARQLRNYAQSTEVLQQLEYWERVAEAEGTVPIDKPGGENTAGHVEAIEMSLEEEETRALLLDVPHTLETQINDVLLTAFAETLTEWCRRERVLIEMERYGREDLGPGMDVSRTIGWFTSLYPVALEWKTGEERRTVLKRVKEQLQQTPRRGMGFGLLKYLCNTGKVRRRMRALNSPEVNFNYLGHVDRALNGAPWFALARESSGRVQDARNRRVYVLEFTGRVSGGRLHTQWLYSQALHQRSTIDWVARRYLTALRALIVQS
jgi:amino acid adenylation domain-containing protein/non-ribosomal peptide synthase protein (TIGR01720 family)